MKPNVLPPGPARNPALELALLAAASGAVLFSLVSISLTQAFWLLALMAWAVLLVRKDIRFAVPTFFWPLLGYAAWSLASAAVSIDPRSSFKDTRELLIILIVPLAVAAFRRHSTLKFPLWALFFSGAAASAIAIVQFALRERPDQRIKGFMGHYMTQAGLLGLFIAFALAQVLFAKGKPRLAWGAVLIPSGAALVMTLTRNAWLGAGAAVVLLVGLWRPKALLLAPIAAALLYFAGPEVVKSRIRSIGDRNDPSNNARIEYARLGFKVIGEKPFFGTGPDTVDELFPDPAYGLGDYAKQSVHLHNNYLQIAAERGLPALAAWLAFLGFAAVHLFRKFRSGGPAVRPLAAAGLGALALLVVAGLFEYNFGDSEVAQLLLLLLALPFAPESGEPTV